MSDRNLSDLDPALQTLATAFLTRANDVLAPAKAAIVVTWRDPTAQNAAKAQGLSNAAAGQSPHNCVDAEGKPASRAFDFAIFDEHSRYITDGTDPRYTTAGSIAKSMGLVWGGNFRSLPDYDHIEMADWRTVA